MDKIRITYVYSAGHSYTEPWLKTNFFCPCCAEKDVWNKNDGGDYYCGEKYLCLKCGNSWDWPSEPRVEKDDEQRIEKIPKVNNHEN